MAAASGMSSGQDAQSTPSTRKLAPPPPKPGTGAAGVVVFQAGCTDSMHKCWQLWHLLLSTGGWDVSRRLPSRCGSLPICRPLWLYHTPKAELSPSQDFSSQPRAGARHYLVSGRLQAPLGLCFQIVLFSLVYILKLPGHSFVYSKQRNTNLEIIPWWGQLYPHCGRTEDKNHNTKRIFQKNKGTRHAHEFLDHATSHLYI